MGSDNSAFDEALALMATGVKRWCGDGVIDGLERLVGSTPAQADQVLPLLALAKTLAAREGVDTRAKASPSKKRPDTYILCAEWDAWIRAVLRGRSMTLPEICESVNAQMRKERAEVAHLELKHKNLSRILRKLEKDKIVESSRRDDRFKVYSLVELARTVGDMSAPSGPASRSVASISALSSGSPTVPFRPHKTRKELP